MTAVTLMVNGRKLVANVAPRTHLADLLRESHNLTGTHIGCEHGVCGACTLLVDGEPTRACITFAVACENAEIVTIEGLDGDEIAKELRAAFSRQHGLQCGYCTPGMIASARDLVLRLETPDETEIRVGMSGNLCRCTGYVGMTRAIQGVIADRRSRGIPAKPGGERRRLGPTGSGHAGEGRAQTSTIVTQGAQQAPPPTRKVPRLEDDWEPRANLKQSLSVSHSVEAVWAFFGDIHDVASCLPGAALDSVSDEGRVEGRIRVKVGPISAEFQGIAQVSRDEATKSGRINGAGRDSKSNSTTRGAIRYVVVEGGSGGTEVDVDIGYALTGMLAQFGRSGLVQDVANRLTAAFVQNLEAKLAHTSQGQGAPPPAMVTELDAGSLMLSVMKDWLKNLFKRALRRNRSTEGR